MRNGLKIMTIQGIEIHVSYTWIPIFLLVTWSLSAGYFPAAYPELGLAMSYLLGTVTSLLFFVSVLLHELAHSLYAKSHGIGIRRITLFLLGGTSEIEEDPHNPRDEFLMAAAGPAASFAIAVIAFGVWLVTFDTGLVAVQAVAAALAAVNFLVAVFNLLPGFPLDGGRIFRAAVWKATGDLERATKIASFGGKGIALLMFVYGSFLLLEGALANGLWLFLLGSFLYAAANNSYAQTLFRLRFGDIKVKEIMQRTEFTREHSADLRPDDTVSAAVLAMEEQGDDVLYVGEGKRIVGILTPQHIRSLAGQ